MSGRLGCPTCQVDEGMAGWVAVDVRPGQPGNREGRETVRTWRPCDECNTERWGAWHRDELRARPTKQAQR